MRDSKKGSDSKKGAVVKKAIMALIDKRVLGKFVNLIKLESRAGERF